MKVLLTSLSAKNIHKTLAPWCLKSYFDFVNQNPSITVDVCEYTINEPIDAIFDDIYMQKPNVLGFSCYIWNIEETQKVCTLIKQALPETIIVLGGPEVSFDAEKEGSYPFADYIMTGEGEKSFALLIADIYANSRPKNRVIPPSPVPLAKLPTPFTENYFASFAKGKMLSIKNQLAYYETSRGCPFSCAYCLSSAIEGVDFLPVERVKQEINLLLSHGATCIKFVDRTFNAKKTRAIEILNYIRSLDTTCTFHFEVAADLFDEEMLDVVQQMPLERVQFEIGIQSTNAQTLDAVCRKTNLQKVLSNIKMLTSFQNCHIHVDLIACLPHDTLETFSTAINDCIAVQPHMLQLGFLKLLKGSALRTQAKDFGCVYSPFSPYQTLKSQTMSIEDIIFLKEIERVIEKFYNSGIYQNTITYGITLFESPYYFFSTLASFCRGKNLRISVKNSYILLLNFLLPYGEKELVEHVIKLDCFTYNTNTELPSNIPLLRDRDLEKVKLLDFPKKTHIKIIHFPYDNTTRLFIYKKRHPITRAFEVEEI